jgi:hypothetical protein
VSADYLFGSLERRSQMKILEIVALAPFTLSMMAFVASLFYLLRLRNKAHSIGQFLLPGHLIFIAPQGFLPVGKYSTPWRPLLLWVCISVVLLLLQKLVVAWLT